MGAAGEALNPTHQTKKLDDSTVCAFRDRFKLPIDDDQFKDGNVPFFRPDEKSPELEYMRERHAQMGGYLP